MNVSIHPSIHLFIHSFILLLLISVEDFARRKTISYRIMAEDGGRSQNKGPMMRQLSEGLIFTTPRPKGVMSCNDLVKRLQFLFSFDTHCVSWGKRKKRERKHFEK